MEVTDIYTNDMDRKIFLKGLIRTALVDKVVADEERIYLRSAAIGLGLKPDDVDELTAALEYDLEKPAVQEYFKVDFDTKAKKIFLLEEIIQLANIDQDYSLAERHEVRKMAKEMGISDNTVEAIEEWVHDGIEWREKGETLLQLED